MKKPSQKRQARKTSRPLYDSLEARQLLAILTVDTTSMLADGSIDGQISLGEAIIASNTNAPYGDAPAGDFTGDRIHFAPSLTDQTISLEGTQLAITDDLVIQGSLTNVTISGGEQSRIFHINTSEDVVIGNVNLVDGKAHEGGALLIQGGGKVRLHRVDFSDNVATHFFSGGGALFNENSKVLASELTFTNNYAFGGGGAIFSADGEVFLYQSKLDSNHTLGAGGALLAVKGSYYINQSEFVDNKAVLDLDLIGEGDRTGDPIGASLDLANLGRSGGAISFSGTTATTVILNSPFTNNEASNNGGAISVAPENRIFIYGDSSFSNNVAQAPTLDNRFGGGAIYIVDSALNIGAATFTANVAVGGSGGAILAKGGSLKMFNSDLNENAAVRRGGGIAIFDTYAYINSARFESNMVGQLPNGFRNDDIPHQAPAGGGLYVGAGDDSYATLFSSLFKFNFASQNGGAIANSGRVLIGGGTFLGGNVAEVRDDTVAVGYGGGGGGIYNTGPLLRFYSSTIQNNEAKGNWGWGGGILSRSGRVDIGFADFNSNRASSGGGLYFSGGSPSLYDTKVQDNAAMSGSGGGIYVGGIARFGEHPFVPLLIIGGSVTGNSAIYSGGGLYAGTGTSVTTHSNPGLNDVLFSENRALRDGGGGLSATGSVLSIRDAVFASNESRFGGGLEINLGRASFHDSSINNNSARRLGGGLYQSGVIASLINTLVVDNSAEVDPNISTKQ